MNINSFDEIFNVINSPDLAETGGSHNQKGVEFQRHWSVMRMFTLEEEGACDFLFLFEAIQDVAILDSCTTPTTICVCQVKKKDRKEWTWADLTALHQPTASHNHSGRGKSKVKPLNDIKDNPLGKLYAAVNALKAIKGTGRFISNARFDLPLATGSNAATALTCSLSELTAKHLELLSKGLVTLHNSASEIPDLSRIHLESVSLPADDPRTYLVGVVHKFFVNRSPRHAAQASSLVDALLARIGSLGARTVACKSFEDVRKQRGYSRSEFVSALEQLENIPDLYDHLNTWLEQLAHEGMGFMDITSIRSAATSISRRRILDSMTDDENRFIQECDSWLSDKPDPNALKPFFDKAYADLQNSFPSIKKHELLAHFALRAIKKCVDQT